MIEVSTPHSRPSPRSQPCWTPLVPSLYKEFTKATSKAKENHNMMLS